MLHSRKALATLSLLIITITAATALTAGIDKKTYNNNPKNPPPTGTVSTSCLSFIANFNLMSGDYGNNSVSMDYDSFGDCDPDANYYIYAGSPIIGWINGSDTIMRWSFSSPQDSIRFLPLTNMIYEEDDNFNIMRSICTDIDSSIYVEKRYYAPKNPDDCNFIIHQLRIFGAGHNGIVVGEVIDWDIPSDSNRHNGSDYYENLMTIWQHGADYDDSISYPCDPQSNDTRTGGIAFLSMYEWNGTGYELFTDSEGRPFHNGITADMITYVYGNDDGFKRGELYELMYNTTGYETYSSANPDSEFTDLFTIMTFTNDYDYQYGDTLNFWYATYTTPIGTNFYNMLSIIQRSRDIYCKYLQPDGLETDPYICSFGCCRKRGDFKHDNENVLVDDLVAYVNYIFKGGDPPQCLEDADVNGDGEINISDLVCLVNYVFKDFFDCVQDC